MADTWKFNSKLFIRLFAWPILNWIATALPAYASIHELQFQLLPQAYQGLRGDEPTLQSNVYFENEWKSEIHSYDQPQDWQVSFHLDAEMLGRRDLSFDLDRAWIRTGQFYWGRVHPWDLSHHPDAKRGWGYLGQNHPQNRATGLGSPFQMNSIFPEPILLGWIGAHYWSDPHHKKAFQWGVSATPLFLPGFGPEVEFEGESGVSTSRFGRRPPGYLTVNEVTVPLRYDLDTSTLLSDVLINPQVMVTTYWKPKSLHDLNYQGWLSIGYAPSAEVQPSVDGYLSVQSDAEDTDEVLTGLATIKPYYPYQWTVNLTQTLSWGFGSVQYVDTDSLGFEVGFDTPWVDASLMHEIPNAFGTKLDSDSDGSSGFDVELVSTPYAHWLAQASATIPLYWIEVRGGIKHHLSQNGTWLRASLYRSILDRGGLEAGFDLFSGGQESYFGEWRTNDRVFLAFQWSFGSKIQSKGF